MRAGNLDRLISIERPVTSLNLYGTPIQTWELVASVRAQLMANAIDNREAEGPKTEATNTFRIYWRGGVSLDNRVVYDGHEYTIQHIAELGRRVGLDLKCRHVGPL